MTSLYIRGGRFNLPCPRRCSESATGARIYGGVRFRPGQPTPEFVHISTPEIRYAHLMFFGKLANEWGLGWDDLSFSDKTSFTQAHGTHPSLTNNSDPEECLVLAGRSGRFPCPSHTGNRDLRPAETSCSPLPIQCKP